MARNLQYLDHTDPKIQESFENSMNSWLDYESIRSIFDIAEELPISTEPTTGGEGLYLFDSLHNVDLIEWDVDGETVGMMGEVQIRYIVASVRFESDNENLRSRLVRRIYESPVYSSFYLIHYKNVHTERGDESSSDSSSGDEDEALEELNGDGEDGEIAAAALAASATPAALAMDLHGDNPGSDVAPVATCSTYPERSCRSCYGSSSGFTASAGTAVVTKEDKAIKNDAELQGMKNSHLRNFAAALAHFWAWLEEEVHKNANLTEVDVAHRLLEFRSAQDGFMDTSFDTISGSGTNGAIIHYKLEPENCSRVDPRKLFLLDSGAQYVDGTTNITTTVPFSEPSTQEKECFNRVLQGPIAHQAVFPEGTAGFVLDGFARSSLWKIGIDYLC